MPEKLKGEKYFELESIELQKYRGFQAARAEEDRIMEEIDKVLASTPNREEAEKIILEKYASLIDETKKKASEALMAWLDEMRRLGEQEQ